MYLYGKPLEEITEADVQALVGAAEGEAAEFKAEMWGTSSAQRRSMVKDIASLANRRGGEIYIGITEEDGTALEVVGVEGEGLAERITQSCRANVEPSLAVLAQPVSLDSGKSVVVVRVPTAFAGPHMITLERMNQFWIRHGRTNALMTVEEIEAAYGRRLEGEARLEGFLRERQAKEARDAAGRSWLSLTATPIFMRTGMIDTSNPRIRRLLSNPPVHSGRHDQSRLWSSAPLRPTLEGISTERYDSNRNLRSQLELHRNGHLHFGSELRIDADNRSVPALLVALQVSEFVQLALDIYELNGLTSPVAFKMTLDNVSDSWLATPTQSGHIFDDDRPYWRRGSMIEVPVVVAELPAGSELGRVRKQLNDLLWNAYRLETCSYFDEGGEFVGRP